MYCTYLTVYSGNKLPPFYIGYTSIANIEKGYRGSVRSKRYGDVWKSELKNNPHLFKTIILTRHLTIPEASEKETFFQEQFGVHENSMYINMSISGKKLFSRKGMKHSEETKSLIREKRKHQVFTEETRARLSASATGRIRSQKSIDKARDKHLGYKHTEETKILMRAPRSDDFKQTMSKTATGMRWWTDGTINKRSRDCPTEGFVIGRVLKCSQKQ